MQLKRKREQDEKELEELIERRQLQRKIKTARIRSLQRDHQRKLETIRDKWDVNGAAGEKQVNAACVRRDEQIHKYFQTMDRQTNHKINLIRRNQLKNNYKTVLIDRIHSQANRREAFQT